MVSRLEDTIEVSFGTRARAKQMASVGAIPGTTLSVRVGAHTTRGDGGGAGFSWKTDAEVASWGLTTAEKDYIGFPDRSPRGGWWVLADEQPNVASVGAFGDETGADPTTPCAAAINALSRYLYLARGGGTMRLSHRAYRCEDHLTPQPYTGFVGTYSAARVFESPGGEEGVEGLKFQPGFVMDAGKQLKISAGFFMENFTGRRAGIEEHTDLEGALDFQVDGFVGTFMQKAAGGDLPSVTLRNIALYGFDFGAIIDKANGLIVDGIYGDCATLLAAIRSGESIRIEGVARKPVLGNNDAIGIEEFTITALSDDGGFVRFTTAENPLTLGLTDGQRLAADKIPDASTVASRRTASNVTSSGFTLVDCVWDPAYATWTPAEIADIKFAFAPGQSSAVLTFANDGGYVRVTTQVAFPFKVGHFALLGAPGNAARGFHQIRTVHSTTDFTLERAWDAGLATIDVTLCEVAAMPKNRRHSSTVTGVGAVDGWGTTEGYALAVIECDGSYITGRFKGGSGLYCDAANAKIYLSGNEGGAAGEIELNDPDTHGVYVGGARCCIFGMASKSNGTSLTVDLRKTSDTFTAVGMELVGDGRALYEQINGTVVLLHCAVRGSNQTVLLDGIGSLTIIGGEITPSMIDASNALDDIERVHFVQVPGASGTNARIMRHTSNSHEWWTNEGGSLTKLLTVADTLSTFTTPVAIGAPTDPGHAARLSDLPAAESAYTATTSGTTTQALTLTGTATAGTVSGYGLGTNYTARKLRIEIVAQRASTSRECAYWNLDALMSRGANASSTVLTRTTGGLTPLAPTDYFDNSGTDPSTWFVSLSLSSQNLIINATGATGADIKWSAWITAREIVY